MTIDEAIEILQTEARESRDRDLCDDADAMELGIEALRQIKEERKQKTGFYRDLLPGETKET